jgi:hypothetical protein
MNGGRMQIGLKRTREGLVVVLRSRPAKGRMRTIDHEPVAKGQKPGEAAGVLLDRVGYGRSEKEGE